MEHLHKIKEALCKELEPYANRSLTKTDLETIWKITSTVKNIDKIMMSEGGYSNDGSWMARGMYSRDGSYGMSNNSQRGSYGDGGYSNGHYVRGHYSRDGYSRGGYSGEGYSNHGGFEEEIDRIMQEGNLSINDKEALMKAKQLVSGQGRM